MGLLYLYQQPLDEHQTYISNRIPSQQIFPSTHMVSTSCQIGVVDITTFYIWRHIYKSSFSIFEVTSYCHCILQNTGSTKHETVDVYLTYHCINRLKPTGYVMHQQFIIQQLYALPTLYLCVLYLSENKQRLVPLTA